MVTKTLVSIVAVLAFAPIAQARPIRPTAQDGRDVMRYGLETYAQTMGGHLVLGKCLPHAKTWIVCRARIDWSQGTSHYRFKVSSRGENYLIQTAKS